MKKALKLFTYSVLGLLGIVYISAVILYLTTAGDYPVLKTISDNPDLPVLETSFGPLHGEIHGKGNKEAVVVIHGGPGNEYLYLLDLKELADNYKVIFYDQRGSGLSPRVPDEELTLEGLTEELKDIIQRYAGGKAHIVGHSWGGMLGTHFAANHPEMVDKLIACEPGFLTSAQFERFMEKTGGMAPSLSPGLIKELLLAVGRTLHAGNPDADAKMDYFMLTLVMDSKLDDHPLAGYYKNKDTATASMPTWRFGARIQQQLFSQIRDKKGNITVPFAEGIENFKGETLIISSEHNVIIGTEHQQAHVELYHNARLVEIPDAGHTMIGENPQASLKAIRSFLR